ncbi:1,4-dihydroxy-2-naphthoate polyprenyltransferase [Rhodoferax sp.]|uniref:1,4-dihydroxy-2-naphthoate polyprenyltransferase n=1 Tax=Rhodoferax sp. TaxID=50421 RepID=UPI00283BFFF6|nr:1,4-dihydroxy-2-naphthoate polyprenyltransferase [Rhodoferax sp.]MDR3367791.1 1,4-dihydroxy-2-naphthoate polyprenyltransferase [Rhodoferax sp.]
MGLFKRSILVIWWTAIRPRTLSMAATPVVLGSALAWADQAAPLWPVFLATLLCALLIQIGTNLHNDVADFERGADRPDRLGPLRVTVAGWATPQSVHRVAALSFALAFMLGAYLVQQGGWPILAIGVASLIAGWAYLGGAHPISHSALGEVFVLVFFGMLAVVGSHWLQSGNTAPAAWLSGAVVGLPAAAVLLVNNYRDREADQRQGRHTLAARLGDRGAERAYATMVLLPFALVLGVAWVAHPGALLSLLALPYALTLIPRLHRQASGAQLNGLLGATAKLGLWLGLLLAMGVFL